MSNSSPVLVSLGSFGAAEVRRHGQLYFARLAHDAGADGVEVRGELLTDPVSELAALRGTGLVRVYSSPEPLFQREAGLDGDALDRAMDRADALGAPQVKMSIGVFGGSTRAMAHMLAALRERIVRAPAALTIENDQTGAAGGIDALQAFFAAADAAGLRLPMTFDMGNWHYVGECPLEAAAAFSGRVGYVHCKGVQRLPQQWVAVRLQQSAAPWRSIMRALPPTAPAAIEFPLAGDDLLAVTRRAVAELRQARAAGQRRGAASECTSEEAGA